MDSKRILDDYLHNSRVVVSSAYSYHEGRYQLPYAFLSLNKDVPYNYPELVLCYSLNKTCEQIKFNGNFSYIIYDVAIGRFFNYMEALTFSKKIKKQHVEGFIKKTYAEIYYSIGDYPRACVAKLYVDEIAKYGGESIIQEYFSSPERGLGLQVLFQELFILYHEVSHYRLKQLPADDYCKKIIEYRNLMLNDDTIIRTHKAGLDEEYVKGLLSRLEHEKSIHLLGRIKEHAVDPHYWKSFYDYIVEYYSQDKNIEEIICDDFAMDSLLEQIPYFQSLFFTSPLSPSRSSNKKVAEEIKELIYTSCYLALENVNYLVKFERDAKHISKRDTVGIDYSSIFGEMPDVQYRKRCLIRAIIRREHRLNPDDKTNKCGIYWSFMAQFLDSLYDDIEEVYQGHYSCCDKEKLVSAFIADKDEDTIYRKARKLLVDILYW